LGLRDVVPARDRCSDWTCWLLERAADVTIGDVAGQACDVAGLD
jgi:hypothetical protein